MDFQIIASIVGIIVVALITSVIWIKKGTHSKKEYYPGTNIVRRIVKYKKNEKNGIEEVFYRTGELNKKKIWVQGRLEGVCETFYKNGSVCIRCHYKKGVLDGSWIAYSMNGSIMESIEYKNGEKVG
jgi:antitoxin component YwqK of YwqJK toxin-antitoxin module